MRFLVVLRVLAAVAAATTIWAIAPAAAFGAECGDSCDSHSRCCCCCDGFWSWYGSDRVFDGTTRAAWYRTWHAPNALATPLREYYIPRDYTYCQFDDYEGHGGEAIASVGFEPIEFERLGRIPNDLAISGEAPAVKSGR